MPIKRSIRDQILIPLVTVQVLAVATTALVSAWLAAGRVEGDVVRKLDGVVETLGRSNFPLTSGVLARMRGLSGAHFVVCSADGTVLESTLPGISRQLLASLQGLPARPRLALNPVDRTTPRLDFEGEGFLAGSVQSPGPLPRPTLLVLYPEVAWRRARWDAAMPPLVVGLLALAPMAAVTGWVAHRLGARLRSVQGRVAAIASGDFAELDRGSRLDEIDELIGSVNQMSIQLREMGQAIRRTERAGALAQLAAGLAHQLRNAATGARMAVQLHRRRCPGASTASGPDGSLDVALRQLALCEEQVKGLLAMGQEGSRTHQTGDACRLIEEVASLVEPACRHANIRFSCDVDLSIPIKADLEGVRAALLNLVLNAIEAAGAGGRVDLQMRIMDQTVHFEVIDDGPGPPTELVATLFEPFVTGKAEGVGLGLALARRVAVEHGGALVWSREAGLTRFRLTIPQNIIFIETSG